MSAGELTFDDLPFEENPIYVLTYAIFVVLVLFVILNLMTSVAVQEIRNQSEVRKWHKFMTTLMWYHHAVPTRIKKCIMKNPWVMKYPWYIFYKVADEVVDRENNIISFKLNKT